MQSNINRLPAPVQTNHLDDQSKNWCLVELLNKDVYCSGVESNSKPVIYTATVCVKMQDQNTLIVQSP